MSQAASTAAVDSRGSAIGGSINPATGGLPWYVWVAGIAVLAMFLFKRKN